VLVAVAVVSVLVSPAPSRADEPAPASVAAASPAEMAAARADVDGALRAMRATSLRVREMLRDARKRGTKQQIACLDEALSRSDVALRHARASGDGALAAYARGDLDEARVQLARVAEWREAQRLAARDGAACAPGAKVVEAARTATTVRVSVDPRIPRVE
jgi:hypothetical protein